MTTAPESSSNLPPNLSESGRTSDLEAGLTAFKQGDYATAIGLLEPSLSDSPNHPLTVRAQMALAIAYEKLGETVQAATICQSLQQTANPQVQEWASRTLASLAKRHPDLNKSGSTATESSPSSVQSKDLTGFQPLEAPSHSSTVEPDRTGFTPVSLPSTASSSSALDTQPPNSPVSPTPPTTLRPQPSGEPTTTDVDLSTTPSLYQPVWQQAERAHTWKSLGKVKLWRLVGV